MSADRDCIVGCFEKAEGEGYMLVNDSLPADGKQTASTLSLKKATTTLLSTAVKG